MAHHPGGQRSRLATMPAPAARMMSSCAGGGGGFGGGRLQLTPLQTLQRMEISKHRAEKALAATGHRDAQLAADWLLAHIHDPSLDEPTRREYILYACPTGAFRAQLERFWSRTRNEHGWNGAHNFVPHITLVSFFQAPDECADQLADALRLAVQMAADSCGVSGGSAADCNGGDGSGGGTASASLLDGKRPLALELSASDNFMGFYVRDGETNDANMLQRLALQYVQNVKEVLGELISDKYEQLDALVTCFPWCGGVTNTRCIPRSSRSISLEPHDNKLHLTLAYKFDPDQYAALHAAATSTLSPGDATHWELRLYSRDPQLAMAANSMAPPLVVHRTVHAQPQAATAHGDQLELRPGDYVYVAAPEAADAATPAWTEGICARTGCSGLIGRGHTERTAESDAWTLHQTVSITAPPPPPPADMPDVAYVQELIRKSALCDLAHVDDAETMAAVERQKQPSQPQQLFVLRHGERVDFTFGQSWLQHAFDAHTGVYRPRDLNMPPELPQRANAPLSWAKDAPLTEIGRHQAWLTGRALRAAGVRIAHVYCSPAFRCVQTCAALLDGLGQAADAECAIRVEPALFEWLVWYAPTEGRGETEDGGLPQWMTVAELREAGYLVDKKYVPVLGAEEMGARLTEDCERFYVRNHAVAERMVRDNANGNILCVGHAVTLDSCTKQLTTGSGRNYADMSRIMPRIAYASLVVAERLPASSTTTEEQTEENGSGGEWHLAAPPCHGMTHNRNARFDWKVLTGKE